ncbi:PAS domain-containing sensor histidine kinase [Aromatoleum diolicum]|uniref:histidine kinase n=1 Tax=Aromatoleum diolicum TaxID=75796 RepID=A0ABX1QI34_9RHOO|nr:PAS domain S-box protein [Aromatoleum diolicum]NMG76889.1 PAS domain S-box protein [Aromatoleum diolicum]
MSESPDHGWIADTPDALILVDAVGVVLEWSPGAERMFGYSRAEAVGSGLDQLVVIAERADEQRGFIAETLAAGWGTFESLRRRKDGTLIYVDISGKRMGDGSAADSQVLFSEKDVTQLKVRRDSKSLEARFGDLLESTPDGIVIANSTGHILVTNSQAERLFGYAPGELRARPVEDLLPERFRASHKGHRSHYFSQPRTRAMGAGLELFGLRKDGSEFPVEISLSPLMSEETPVVISAVRDVSERKCFEQALQEKNLELENANRAKDRFLASMSHELRTPLNAVIGFSGTLLMKLPGELNADQTHQLEIIRGSARHLLALINDLLHLAKIEAGKVELHPELVDCNALIEEVAATLRPQAVAKDVALELDVPVEPVVFRTDRRAVSQIVINLTNNAIKFTERGSVRMGLSAGDFGGQRRLEFSVQDTGPGIREDELATLFEPFVQGQASRIKGVEGTGLGLHLSRTLAGLLGGTLTCRSTYGEGCVFTLVVTEI